MTMHSNDTPKPKPCAIYARTTHENSAEIDRQAEACGLRASELGAEVQFMYVDNGVSGMEISENLEHLLAAARLGAFDYLIVEDQARLSLSMAVLLFIQAELSTQAWKSRWPPNLLGLASQTSPTKDFSRICT
jgi:DNA invertase Pin-like site-specific DNA recombinase